jgi:hypothetical protein
MTAENRMCLSTMTEMPAPARNVAELLCDLGLVLRWREHCGAGTKGASLPQSLRWDSQLALQFVNLRAVVQLRAMVEGWPLHRIQETVQAQGLEKNNERASRHGAEAKHLPSKEQTC